MGSSFGAMAHMHLKTAREMPKKKHPVLYGERAASYERKARRERRQIALYYILMRRGAFDGYGKAQASLAHRYGVVVSASEAKSRIEQGTN